MRLIGHGVCVGVSYIIILVQKIPVGLQFAGQLGFGTLPRGHGCGKCCPGVIRIKCPFDGVLLL